MISIVISTYRPEYLEKLIENIKQTIGVPYEIVAIDNSIAKKGLCAIYNEGTQKSRYPIICYAHEDINIKTKEWGKVVVESFNKNSSLGLLGIAGSTYKPATPSGWSFPWASHQSTTYMNILQSDKESVGKRHVYSNPKELSLAKVVSVDGVWLCTKKEIALQIPFDETMFKNFHCYDVDFSLSILQKYEVAVTFEVLIEHFSEGNFGEDWLNETIKLHKKWEKVLPVNMAELTEKQKNNEEEYAFLYLLHIMEKYDRVNSEVYKILWNKYVRAVFSFKTFMKLNLIICKTLYKHFSKRKQQKQLI